MEDFRHIESRVKITMNHPAVHTGSSILNAAQLKGRVLLLMLRCLEIRRGRVVRSFSYPPDTAGTVLKCKLVREM